MGIMERKQPPLWIRVRNSVGKHLGLTCPAKKTHWTTKVPLGESGRTEATVRDPHGAI